METIEDLSLKGLLTKRGVRFEEKKIVLDYHSEIEHNLLKQNQTVLFSKLRESNYFENFTLEFVYVEKQEKNISSSEQERLEKWLQDYPVLQEMIDKLQLKLR